MVQHLNHDVHMHQGRFGLSLLNSMIGGYLEKENNPLAVQMGFYHHAKHIDLDSPLTTQLNITLSNKVVIFVHGLSNLENVWDYPPDGGSTSSILSHYIDVCLESADSQREQNYGTKLNEEHGYTPLFLRYNTGLSLEKNAQNFNRLLNKLYAAYPNQIEELMLVGYGMGGRLLSHTQFMAQAVNAAWLSTLSRCLYLGKLNEGSFLTLALRLGSVLFRRLPVLFNHNVANWLNQKSQQLQEKPHNSPNKSSMAKENPAYMTFLEDKRHMFIDGDLNSENRNDEASNKYIVPPLAPSHSQNAYIEGISPIRLTHSDRVYALMSNWLSNHNAQAIDLQTYSQPSADRSENPPEESSRPSDTGNILLAGTVGLVASVYDKTVETIETVHYSIVEEPFYALEKVPVVSQIAKPVENAQRVMLDSFYRDLRSRGKKIHQLAAEMI